MARTSSRLGLLATLAAAVRSTLRPGSPGVAERASAVPRLVRAALRGDYPHASRGHVVALVAATLSILSPVDLVPEAVLSVFGLVDDVVIAGWLAATLLNDTEAFLVWERARPSRPESRGAGSPHGVAVSSHHPQG